MYQWFLVQEKPNSIADAVELGLSRTNPRYMKRPQHNLSLITLGSFALTMLHQPLLDFLSFRFSVSFSRGVSHLCTEVIMNRSTLCILIHTVCYLSGHILKCTCSKLLHSSCLSLSLCLHSGELASPLLMTNSFTFQHTVWVSFCPTFNSCENSLMYYIDGLVQERRNSIANALEFLH